MVDLEAKLGNMALDFLISWNKEIKKMCFT